MNRLDLLTALAAAALPLGIAGAAEAADAPMAAAGSDVIGVIAREVAAYNAKDLTTILSLHAPTATITILPYGKVLASGTDGIAAFFKKDFADHPDAKLVFDKQFVIKSMVINHYPLGPQNLLSMYDVQNGLIANEWIIIG